MAGSILIIFIIFIIFRKALASAAPRTIGCFCNDLIRTWNRVLEVMVSGVVMPSSDDGRPVVR